MTLEALEHDFNIAYCEIVTRFISISNKNYAKLNGRQLEEILMSPRRS